MPLQVLTGDAAELLPELGSIDLLVTDPPYLPEADSVEWRQTPRVLLALREAVQHVRAEGFAAVMCAGSGPSMLNTLDALRPVLPFCRMLAWVKFGTWAHTPGPFSAHLSPVLLFGRARGRVWKASYVQAQAWTKGESEMWKHPSPVPRAVADWLAEGLLGGIGKPPGEVDVVDPFCGSGALLHPFARAGANCLGIEINPEYAAVARGEEAPWKGGLPFEAAPLPFEGAS